MDKFNIPSDDNNINGAGDWKTVPDDISDTAELPIIDQANDDKDADESDPEAREDDSSVFDSNQNVEAGTVAETIEHKSHKLRNTIIGAVAIAAMASGIALFNGNNSLNSQAQSPQYEESDSDNSLYDDSSDNSISNNPLDTIDSSQDDSDWPTIIHKEKTDNDGVILTTDELAQAAGVGDTTELAEQSPEYACTLLEEWADYYDLGVTECFVGNYNDMPMPIISTGYKTEDGTYYLITIGVKPSSDQFIIQIGRGDGSGETYSYESSGLPDSDRLEEIIRTNNL